MWLDDQERKETELAGNKFPEVSRWENMNLSSADREGHGRWSCMYSLLKRGSIWLTNEIEKKWWSHLISYIFSVTGSRDRLDLMMGFR